jgi:hypothetical protein
MQQAQQNAAAKKQAEEQSKMKIFLEWLQRMSQQQPRPQNTRTSPAGGYISKEYTKNRLDEAGRY